jgi:hypothetical protein
MSYFQNPDPIFLFSYPFLTLLSLLSLTWIFGTTSNSSHHHPDPVIVLYPRAAKVILYKHKIRLSVPCVLNFPKLPLSLKEKEILYGPQLLLLI